MKTNTLAALLIAVASSASIFATPEVAKAEPDQAAVAPAPVKDGSNASRAPFLVPTEKVTDAATDRTIEKNARSSYNYSTVLDNKIAVQSDNGVVTLTGTVEDAEAKGLAADTVAGMPGVRSVANDIEVKSTVAEHSDAWIAMKVRSRLLVKSNVSMASTTVAVNEGVVTLTGTAENAAQKDLTAAYAGDIAHVKSVQNNLIVTEPTGRTMGDAIDDASITSQVKFALLTHGSTSAVKTKIETKDGIVGVSGEASSDAEKALVTKLTESVRGVKSVNNTMSVVKA